MDSEKDWLKADSSAVMKHIDMYHGDHQPDGSE